MSTSFTPKSTICNKIPLFEKHKFFVWKSKAVEALEFMDFDMLDTVNKGRIAAMHQSSNDGASSSKMKGKFVPEYNKEEKAHVESRCKGKICYWKLSPLFCLSFCLKLFNCLLHPQT